MKSREKVLSIAASLILFLPITSTPQHEHPGQTKTTSPTVEAMMEPHRKLMMAYAKSMSIFASAINDHAMRSQGLDVEIARATVSEIRHDLDAMEALHQKHMKMMTPEMHAKMQTMMQEMNKTRETLKEHIKALETAVHAEKPDATQVRTHATALVNQLEEMSKMHDSERKRTSTKM